MSFYIIKNDTIYCEVLHPVHYPEMAVCAFDTENRAKEYIKKYKIKANAVFIKGPQEMALNTISGPHNGKDWQMLPINPKIELELSAVIRPAIPI